MTRDRPALISRLGSLPILLVSLYLLRKTDIFPFVALFTVDAPGASHKVVTWLACAGLIASPVIALYLVARALVQMFRPARRFPSWSLAIAVVPLAAWLALGLPSMLSRPLRCVEHPARAAPTLGVGRCPPLIPLRAPSAGISPPAPRAG